MTLPVGQLWPLTPANLICWRFLGKRARILLRAEEATTTCPALAAGFRQGPRRP